MNKDLLLTLGMYRQKENVSDVRLETKLNNSQSKQLHDLLESQDKIFLIFWERCQSLSTKSNW